MKPGPLTIARLLRVSAGLLVWSSAFVMLYAGYSLGCQHLTVPAGTGRINPVTLGLVAIALLHAAVLVALLLRWRWRPTAALAGESDRSRQLRHWLEGFVLWISLAGLIFIAFPILLVPPCAG